MSDTVSGSAPLRTSLQRHAPSGFTPEQVQARARQRAARAWREEGILVISVEDDRLTWPERELIRHLGERLAGAKPGAR